jgi:uncharacterized repeat protein (TIGR01451 family)
MKLPKVLTLVGLAVILWPATALQAIPLYFPNAAPGWTFHVLLDGEGTPVTFRYPALNSAGTQMVYRTGDFFGVTPTVYLADVDLTTYTVSNSTEIDTGLVPPSGGTYLWFSHPIWSRDDSKILFLAGDYTNLNGDLVIYDVGTGNRTIYHFPNPSAAPGWFENSDFIGGSTHNIVFEYNWQDTGGGTIWTVDLSNLASAQIITGSETTVNGSPMNRVDPYSDYAGDVAIHWRGPDSAPVGVVKNTMAAGGSGEGTVGFGPGYWAAYSGRFDDKILSTGDNWNGDAIKVYDGNGALLLDLLGPPSGWQSAYSWKDWEGPWGGIVFRADASTGTAGNSVFYATPSPSLGKAFNPAAIDDGGTSMLTITLSNPSFSDATLAAALTDTLPAGLVVAATPNAATTCSGTGAVVATSGGGSVTLPATRSIPAGSVSGAGSCTVTVNVTNNAVGSFTDILAPGDLQTSNGNNGALAFATLTVNGAASSTGGVSLAKQFSPATVAVNATATLTITLSNLNNTGSASLTSSLADTLPAGLLVASPANAGTTCPGSGAVAATSGGSSVTLPTGRSIPQASGTTPATCTMSVEVTSATAGNYLNTLPINALATDKGSNPDPASATLTVQPRALVTPPSAPATAVPALKVSMLALLALLLLAAGFLALRP